MLATNGTAMATTPRMTKATPLNMRSPQRALSAAFMPRFSSLKSEVVEAIELLLELARRRLRSPVQSPALGHHFLGVSDRARRVEALRTGPGAVHDRVTAIEAERIFEPVQALASALIAAVGKPAVRLQQDRRAEILILVPPIARAGGRAAETQNAFPLPVEFGPILR